VPQTVLRTRVSANPVNTLEYDYKPLFIGYPYCPRRREFGFIARNRRAAATSQVIPAANQLAIPCNKQGNWRAGIRRAVQQLRIIPLKKALERILMAPIPTMMTPTPPCSPTAVGAISANPGLQCPGRTALLLPDIWPIYA
jgi:hypothetical protein